MDVENSSNVAGKGGKTSFPIHFRYIVAIMGSIATATNFIYEVNVSVAIIAMVNHTSVKLSTSQNFGSNSTMKVEEICISNDTTAVVEDGPFVWDESFQGLILSSYFWGALVSTLPGGRLADIWSPRWILNGSVLINIAACLCTPIAAQAHYSLFIVMRVIQGIAGGVMPPALHAMVSRWSPPNERSVMVSIIYAGTALGTVISILLSGLLASNLGWKFIFYVEGTIGLIWCFAWWLLIADSPEESKLISKEEKIYIMTSLGHSKQNDKKKLPVPWRQVLCSKPFLVILITHFCNNFGWYMVLTELPTFMKQILKFDMSSNAKLSSLPFLCMWIFTMVFSKVLAVMQEKDLISMMTSRKIATCVTSLIPSLCLFGVSYIGCNRVMAVVLMTIAVSSFGAMYCGFLTNVIDIAPNFAGTLLATTSCIATIPGFLTPIFVGKLTQGNQTIKVWRTVFFVAVGLHIIEILVYTIFGSCNEEPWNTIELSNETCDQTLPLKDITQTDSYIKHNDLNCA